MTQISASITSAVNPRFSIRYARVYVRTLFYLRLRVFFLRQLAQHLMPVRLFLRSLDLSEKGAASLPLLLCIRLCMADFLIGAPQISYSIRMEGSSSRIVLQTPIVLKPAIIHNFCSSTENTQKEIQQSDYSTAFFLLNTIISFRAKFSMPDTQSAKILHISTPQPPEERSINNRTTILNRKVPVQERLYPA